MPQISAFARAINPNNKTWTDLANVHDGNTSTHGKITTLAQCEDHFTMYGFDFSDIPDNAFFPWKADKPNSFHLTVRSSTGVMIKLMLQRISWLENGLTVFAGDFSDGEITLQGVYHNSVENNSYTSGFIAEHYANDALRIIRSKDGLNVRGRQGAVPSNYTGLCLDLGSKATGLNKSNVTIYSVMVALDYELVTEYTPPIYVGNKRADVYVGNKKVNGIYRGTTLIT